MDKTKATFIVLSSFLALSAASAGVSTLAWFNLNRTANLSVSKVTIHKVSGSLRAHIYDINGSDSGVDVDDPSYEAGINESLAASSSMDAVSSRDGLTFYRPIWKNTAGAGQPAYSIDTIENNAQHSYYSQFLFTIVNVGTADLDIYLSPSTLIAADNEASNSAALATWTRVAINEYDASAGLSPDKDDFLAGDLKMVFENKTGSVTKGRGDTYIESDVLQADETPKIVTYADDDPHFYIEDMEDIAEVETTSKQFFGTFSPNEIHYYVVSLWVEGTEADAQEDANHGAIALSLGIQGK